MNSPTTESIIRETLDALTVHLPFGLLQTECRDALAASGVEVTEKELHVFLRDSAYPITVNTRNYRTRRYGICGEYQPADTPSAVITPYLWNTRRLVNEKPKQGDGHYAHQNYHLGSAILETAFQTHCLRGQQIVPGGFYPRRERGKPVIRTKDCLSHTQVFIVEFDKDLHYSSLEEMLDAETFLRENAYMLSESFSGFPNARAWFLTPRPLTGDLISFVIARLTAEFSGRCDASGSRPIQGALGRKGRHLNHIVLNNFIAPETLSLWNDIYNAQPIDKPRTSERIDVSESDLEELPTPYRDFLRNSKPSSDGWHGRVPCIFGRLQDDGSREPHANDGWDSTENATVLMPVEGGFIHHCHKCGESRFIGKRPSAPQTQAQLLSDVKAGTASSARLRRPKHRALPEDVTLTESTVTAIRERLAKELDDWDSGIRLFNTSTGSGKTHLMLDTISPNRPLIFGTKHEDLTDEIIERASTTHRQANALRWRSPDYGKKTYGEGFETLPMSDAVCKMPDFRKALQDANVNVYKAWCNEYNRCPHYNDCVMDGGYLWQFTVLPTVDLVAISTHDMLTDPSMHHLLDRMLAPPETDDEDLPEPDETDAPTEREHTIVCDDFSIDSAFLNIHFSKGQLHAWMRDWKFRELGDFARDIVIETETATTDAELYKGLHTVWEKRTDAEIAEIERQLTLIPVEVTYTALKPRRHLKEKLRKHSKQETLIATERIDISWEIGETRYQRWAYIACSEKVYKGYQGRSHVIAPQREIERKDGIALLTLADCLRIGLYEIDPDNPESLKDIPRLYDSAWNPVTQIRLFLEHYPHAETAPICKVPDAQTDEPLLQLTLPPQMHPAAKQKRVALLSATTPIHLVKLVWPEATEVNTEPLALHPQHTLLACATGNYARYAMFTDRTYTETTATTTEFLNLMENGIRANPDKRFAIITVKALADLHGERWDAHENVVSVRHYQKMVGMDSEYHDVDIGYVIGSPEVGDTHLLPTLKALYGNSVSKAFSLEKNPTGGYSDTNAKAVRTLLVEAQKMQAIGRFRLGLEGKGPKIVVVWTALDNAQVNHHAHRFDITDFQLADGDPTQVKAVLASRETEIQRLLQLPTKQLAGELKTTERLARNWKRDNGGISKADELTTRRTAVQACKAKGISQRDAAKQLGLSRKQVYAVWK